MLTFFSRRTAGAPSAKPQTPFADVARPGLARAAPAEVPAGTMPGAPEPENVRAGACIPARRGARRPCDPELVYPPADPGLPAVAAADIVASQSALVARLRRAVGGDDAAFAALHLAPI